MIWYRYKFGQYQDAPKLSQQWPINYSASFDVILRLENARYLRTINIYIYIYIQDNEQDYQECINIICLCYEMFFSCRTHLTIWYPLRIRLISADIIMMIWRSRRYIGYFSTKISLTKTGVSLT